MSNDILDDDLNSWSQSPKSQPLTIADIYRSTLDETAASLHPFSTRFIPDTPRDAKQDSLPHRTCGTNYSARNLLWRLIPIIVVCYIWFSVSERKVKPVQLVGGGEEIAPMQTLGAALEATLDQIEEDFEESNTLGSHNIEIESHLPSLPSKSPTVAGADYAENTNNLLSHLLNMGRRRLGLY
mmetsp:Transcript_36540/g.72387  ORF Transcript_36540/g.72387 Transcript_36540/m.72387 type:complete len:183 (-) Transcript_36540:225-773(-)